MFKYIDKISVEIEGGWDKARNDLIRDGSINAGDFSNSVCCGELIPKKPFEDTESLFKWMEENYPTESQVKCSIHTHFSFKSINYYTQLMSPVFYDQFLKDMRTWQQDYPCRNEFFAQRLNGENRFCRGVFMPEQQIKMKSKGGDERYTHLNFCYGMHKTLECRLLPLFVSAETAKSAIMAIVNSIESYLESAPEFKEILEDELDEEDESHKILNDDVIEVKSEKILTKPFSLFAGYQSTKLPRQKRLTKKDKQENIGDIYITHKEEAKVDFIPTSWTSIEMSHAQRASDEAF